MRRKPEGERRQAEAVAGGGVAECKQALGRDAGALRQVADVTDDELLAEDLVAGRDRRVGREDGRATHLVQRVVGRDAGLDKRPRALDRQEGRMALVHVEDGWRDSERRQRADAADAEQQLLADPVLAIAAVERVRQPLDVEQIERHRADVVAPHRCLDGDPCELHLHVDRLAHEAERLRIERGVRLGLASLRRKRPA